MTEADRKHEIEKLVKQMNDERYEIIMENRIMKEEIACLKRGLEIANRKLACRNVTNGGHTTTAPIRYTEPKKKGLLKVIFGGLSKCP